MKNLTGAKITGIIYLDELTDEKKLSSGMNIKVKLLTNSKVVGVLFRKESADESILSDLLLDGLTYRTTSEDDDRILEASKITAILYGEPAALDKQVPCDLRIKGLIYQEEGSDKAKLLTDFSHTVHIVSWPQVTGVLCRYHNSLDKKIFESASISGFLYQDEGREDINLVSGVSICGVLCEQA
ncbi:MAG: hypothetical protein ACXW1O_06805 [Halobacteriota archaeon]